MKVTRFIPLGIALLLSMPALAQTTTTEESKGSIRGSLIEEEADATAKAQEERQRQILLEATENGTDPSRVIIIKNDSVLFEAFGPEGARSFGVKVDGSDDEDDRVHVIVQHDNEVLFETFDNKEGGYYHMKVDAPKEADGRAHIIVTKKGGGNSIMMLENRDEVEKAQAEMDKAMEQMEIELEQMEIELEKSQEMREKAMEELERALEEAGEEDAAVIEGNNGAQNKRIVVRSFSNVAKNDPKAAAELERLVQGSGAHVITENVNGNTKVMVIEGDPAKNAEMPEGVRKMIRMEKPAAANGKPRMQVRVLGDSNCINRLATCGQGGKKIKVKTITMDQLVGEEERIAAQGVNGAQRKVVVRMKDGDAQGKGHAEVIVIRTAKEREREAAKAEAAAEAQVIEERAPLAEPKVARSGYTLDANVPNPFTGTTTINFAIPTAEHVTLAVYNSAGEKVQTLKDEEIPAGAHSVVFDASKLPSGMYFYKLTARDYTATKSMNVTK